MTPLHVLLLAFLIGLFAGLRSLTPPAAVAWGAHWGWLNLPHLFSWIGTTLVAVIFTVLALVELINDKLPKTPNRTVPAPAIVRILMGAFAGACVATAGAQGIVVGALVGVAGALVGTFGGYHARKGLVKALGSPDFVVALVEDLIAVGGSLWVVSRF
jgi:uncharacterized membrane protein